jgi:hypothetical protein
MNDDINDGDSEHKEGQGEGRRIKGGGRREENAEGTGPGGLKGGEGKLSFVSNSRQRRIEEKRAPAGTASPEDVRKGTCQGKKRKRGRQARTQE